MKKYRIDYEAQTDEGIKSVTLMFEDDNDKDPIALANFIADIYRENTILSFTMSTVYATGGYYDPKQLRMFGEG